jgi:hypothetical protein
MQKTKTFDHHVQKLLDMIGGEPLTGSGFDSEEPHPEYGAEEDE